MLQVMAVNCCTIADRFLQSNDAVCESAVAAPIQLNEVSPHLETWCALALRDKRAMYKRWFSLCFARFVVFLELDVIEGL